MDTPQLVSASVQVVVQSRDRIHGVYGLSSHDRIWIDHGKSVGRRLFGFALWDSAGGISLRTMRSYGPQTLRAQTSRPGNHRLPLIFQHRAELQPETILADPYGRDPKLARLEAALMLADEPLTARRLTEAVDLRDITETRKLIEQLRAWYDADATAFQIVDLAGGYQLLTRSEYHHWLYRLRRTGYDVRLTAAALETLAVIAYKQPIMRAEIEKIRGVNCSELLRLLMEKGLVRIAGRHDSLGRPQLYGTTKKFLQVFGMNSLRDLPEVETLQKP
jgi:segregation and condensation protein B